MSDVLERIKRVMHREEHPICPHCGEEIDMTDTERAQSHVTYWGSDEAVEDECPHCGKTIYMAERVSRSWTAQETPEWQP